MKQVASYTDAFDFTVLYCIFSVLALFIALLLHGRGIRPTPFRHTSAIALLQICRVASLAQWASVSSEAGEVAILSYTMLLWMAVFITLFPGERLRCRQYFTILTAAFGLSLVLQPWQLDFPLMKDAMLVILSSVSWGASAIVAKRLHAHHPCMDLLSLTSWQMLYAALVMSVVVLLVSQREIGWQPAVFWALAYGAILAIALAWSLRLFVLKNLPANIVSLNTLTAPVRGVLFPWWLLGENPGAVEGSGIMLTVLTPTLVSRKKKEAVSVKRT